MRVFPGRLLWVKIGLALRGSQLAVLCVGARRVRPGDGDADEIGTDLWEGYSIMLCRGAHHVHESQPELDEMIAASRLASESIGK